MDHNQRDAILIYTKLRSPFLKTEDDDRGFLYSDGEIRLRAPGTSLDRTTRCQLETMAGDILLDGPLCDVVEESGVQFSDSAVLTTKLRMMRITFRMDFDDILAGL